MDSITGRPSLLHDHRLWFLVDGIVTGATAVAYLVLSQLLPGVLGSVPALYLTAGVVLALVTAGLLTVTGRGRRPGALARILVVINIAWAAASFVVALVDPLGLTPIGIGWTAAQGVVVLGFGLLQARSLRGRASR